MKLGLACKPCSVRNSTAKLRRNVSHGMFWIAFSARTSVWDYLRVLDLSKTGSSLHLSAPSGAQCFHFARHLPYSPVEDAWKFRELTRWQVHNDRFCAVREETICLLNSATEMTLAWRGETVLKPSDIFIRTRAHAGAWAQMLGSELHKFHHEGGLTRFRADSLSLASTSLGSVVGVLNWLDVGVAPTRRVSRS